MFICVSNSFHENYEVLMNIYLDNKHYESDMVVFL